MIFGPESLNLIAKYTKYAKDLCFLRVCAFPKMKTRKNKHYLTKSKSKGRNNN